MDALALTPSHWGMDLTCMTSITSRGQTTAVNSCCLWGTQGQGAIINLSLICIETQSYWDSSVPGTQRKKGGKTFF